MKFKLHFLFFYVALFFCSTLQAQLQYAATASFMTRPISPTINSFGGAGVSLPISDGFAVHYNPAQLGAHSRHTTAAIAGYPGSQKNIYLKDSDISFNSFVISGGYQFESSSIKSVGIALWRSSIEYFEITETDDTGEIIRIYRPQEAFNAISLGAVYQKWVNIYGGLTYKRIASKLGYPFSSSDPQAEPETYGGDAVDYGFILEFPLISTSEEQSNFLNLSLGYANNNVGSGIRFSDQKKDLLTRIMRLGYTLSFGYKVRRKAYELKMMEFNLIAETNDLLVKEKDNELKYQHLLGDVNIFKHLFALQSSTETLRRLGARFTIGEFFSASIGHVKGYSDPSFTTYGARISLGGLLFFANETEPKRKYDIQFAYSNYKEFGNPTNPHFYGLEFSFLR